MNNFDYEMLVIFKVKENYEKVNFCECLIEEL